MGSVSKNSHNSKPSSITSHDDDYGEFMSDLRNLGFIEFPGTISSNNLGVGSTSFSVSSEQGEKKEEISYGGQFNGALGKRPASSCVTETSSKSPNSMPYPITSHNDDGDFMATLKNLGFKFSVSSEQGSQKEEISYGDQVNKALGKRPVNSCVFKTSSKPPFYQENYPSTCAKTLMTRHSCYAPASACAPNFSNQLRGLPMKDDQANRGMEYSVSNGYSLYPTNGYDLNTNRGLLGGSVLHCFQEGVDMVVMAKTHNGSQILNCVLGAENKETRGRIFAEVFVKIPEQMIDPNEHEFFQKITELMSDPNGHYVFQKLFNSRDHNEFQIILRKLTSENRFLIDAAFDGHGSFSIQEFIKRLKKSTMASTVTLIVSTSFFEMMGHPTARDVIYECLNHIMRFQPNKNTQKAKSRVRPPDDNGGLDHLDLEQYGFIETSPEMTLEQYGFIEIRPEMTLEQYGFIEIWPETTTSAANPSSSAQFESEDGTTKVPLNLISSNNTQTESKPDSSPGNAMGSTNYIMCLNKDCYKCLPFTDTSHSGSTGSLGIASFMLNDGESKEGTTSGTESAATCRS